MDTMKYNLQYFNHISFNGFDYVIPEKTLKKDALEANGMNSVDKITYKVTNGKNAMPAFGGRLDDSDIEDVANYVLSQSEKGWD